MKTNIPDPQLEFEIQEIFIQSTHWLEDAAFAEDELRFFKTVLRKYHDVGETDDPGSFNFELGQTLNQLEEYVTSIKAHIQEYLKFLEPYINDQGKLMDLDLLANFNMLAAEISGLFNLIRKTKATLFNHAESLMTKEKMGQ